MLVLMSRRARSGPPLGLGRGQGWRVVGVPVGRLHGAGATPGSVRPAGMVLPWLCWQQALHTHGARAVRSGTGGPGVAVDEAGFIVFDGGGNQGWKRQPRSSAETP